MAAALLSCVSVMSMAGPRVYYAMAKDGRFLRTAARLHPLRQTPVASIFFQGLASVAMVLTGTFEALIYSPTVLAPLPNPLREPPKGFRGQRVDV
jgi:basic amino acid/polyamine antiporter, APA family